MKNSFLKHRAFLGLLMAVVLVLGVAEIAEALTLTRVSEVSQSKRLGSSFEITFSVGLTSPTIAYDSERRRVSDHNDQTTESALIGRIDSAGYRVTYIGTTAYRNTAGDVTGFVGPRPPYATDTSGNALPTSQQSINSSSPYYVDTSRNVVDSEGRPVYLRTGAGVRASTGVAADPYRYERAKLDPTMAIVEDDRFDFNEESISIASEPSSNITITDQRDGQSAATMAETASFAQLRSRVTLDCDVTAVGTYVITITDTTPDEDFPANRVPTNKQSITFTLYVTEQSSTLTAGTNTIAAAVTRVDTGLEKEPVSRRFTIAPNPGNVQVRYRVVEGSGTLYVGNEERTQGTPTTDLTVHQSVEVWINTNRTNNKVTATLQGGDPNVNSFRASIVFEYTGSDRRITTTTSNQNQQNQQQQNQQQQNQQQTTPNRLGISLSGSGNTRTVQVSALAAGTTSTSGIFVTLTANGGTLSLPSGATPLTSTWTLPSAAGTYTVVATTTAGYTSASESVTVTVPGTLTAIQEDSVIRVTASPAPSSNLAFRLTTSGGVYAGGGEILPAGFGRAIPIGLTTGSHILTVTAEGYNSTQVSFTPGTQTTTDTTTTTTTTTTQTGTPGVADRIEIEGSRSLQGTVNQVLRLRTQVVDTNNRGVSDVRVTFRVLAPGKGRLSQRGNGRAVAIETDRNGDATASLTPLGGDLIVEAKAAGVRTPVSFIIDVDGGADTSRATAGEARQYSVGARIPISLESTLNFVGSRTIGGTTYTCMGPGECVISYGLVTKGQIRTEVPKPEVEYTVGDKVPVSLGNTLSFSGRHTVNGTIYTCISEGNCVISYGLVTKGRIRRTIQEPPATPASPRSINPEVLLEAKDRPPMLWVDGGVIYTLVSADVQEFATGVTNVQDIAVSGNKIYWTEQTGENSGTIHSANLDGTGRKQLVSIRAVPRGITVDPVAKRLYWTNSHGYIQSSNLQGGARRNVARDLSNPMRIAVSGRSVYWTDDSAGQVDWRVMGEELLNGYMGIGAGAESVTISGNKLYWTEQTGANAGTINSINLTTTLANVDGTEPQHLISIRAVPSGITVDPVAKRLYWTNSHGWIQSSNLQGTARRNVAKGLGNPGSIVVNVNIKAPATASRTQPPTSKPNYDIDGNGTVDNTDVFLVALAVGTNKAAYDVNGDGTVNDKDIALVRDNRDEGAAGAPMVFGMKLTADQIRRIEEQIGLLVATGDRSPATLKTLVYLQQLIATARPEKTQLLANYPNPFNPETWMPYELATDTDVRITIYAANGVVVRTLHLGQQSAGYYTDRERAAYWDGRNAAGETVASGVYFYQLETDEMSSLRKMVILK